MKIALLRHFKVCHTPPKWCDADSYNLTMMEYDAGVIIPDPAIAIPPEYTVCYCSPLPRAIETAKHLFRGEPVILRELEEVPLRAPIRTRLALPFHMWHGINRVCWLLNFKKLAETRKQTELRASLFVEKLLTHGHSHVLVVTHGLFMANLLEAILKKGFDGPRFFRAEHGRLYEYQDSC